MNEITSWAEPSFYARLYSSDATGLFFRIKIHLPTARQSRPDQTRPDRQTDMHHHESTSDQHDGLARQQSCCQSHGSRLWTAACPTLTGWTDRATGWLLILSACLDADANALLSPGWHGRTMTWGEEDRRRVWQEEKEARRKTHDQGRRNRELRDEDWYEMYKKGHYFSFGLFCYVKKTHQLILKSWNHQHLTSC